MKITPKTKTTFENEDNIKKNEDDLKNEDKLRNADKQKNENKQNPSRAAPGALAHRLQRRNACKI